MSSGGSRARSGPAPDPMAARRDRKDDAAWTTLPSEPVAVVPNFPLSQASDAERDLWAELWMKPQAHMWLALDLKFQVAFYVRNYLRASDPDAKAAWIAPVLRQEAELGLSTPGMNTLRWRFSADGSEPTVGAESKRPAARRTASGDWLKAVTVDDGA